MKTLSLVPANSVSTVETATFFGALRNVGVGLYKATAKFAGYNAALPSNTTRAGGMVGTNSNSTFASMQRVGMNFTAELVAKNSAIGAAYLSQRQNYCSSQLTYIPSTGDTGLDAEIKQYLHGYDGFGGVFSEMGVACSMQDAFMRTADQELPVRGDSGLIFWRDAQSNLRLLEFSADQLGEIYSFTNPRTCFLSRNSDGQIIEGSVGTPCVYFAGIYMSGADTIAFKIYERTNSFYGNPTIYDAADVIFFKDPASFRGIRGVTIFANALEHMQKGEDMLQAALSSAQRQARTAFYVTNGRGGPDETSYETDVFSDGLTSYRERIPGGPLVEYGYTGETMAAVSPTTPGPEIIQGVETADERVAIALRTNYAFLISCTKVGGAPSRLEVEKANKEFQRIQNTIHRPRLRRIIDVVLMDAMRKGELQPPRGMTAEQFKRGRWQLPISPSVDAFYDAKENIAMMRSGLESAQDIIAETNRNSDEVLEKSKQWAIACSKAVQDANDELKADGYKGDVTAMDIAQVSDNPQQAAQAEGEVMGNPENKETAKMGAFIRDVKVSELPEDVQHEIWNVLGQGDHSNKLVSKYMMTTLELLAMADSHNLETARHHIRNCSNAGCADEIHSNLTKHVLAMNGKIADGHHFLAKAEKGKVSKSLPVIDLSPVRFQTAALSEFDSSKHPRKYDGTFSSVNVMDQTQATSAAYDASDKAEDEDTSSSHLEAAKAHREAAKHYENHANYIGGNGAYHKLLKKQQAEHEEKAEHHEAMRAESATARMAFDESKHPRGQPENKGEFGPGDGSAATKEKTKAKPSECDERCRRAKHAAVRVDAATQQQADVVEREAAKDLGGISFKDSEPVDVVIGGKDSALEHGIEFKHVSLGANDKLTMNTYAQIRKINWEKDNKATFHTLVYDDRNGERAIYYRRGVAGSARLGSMHKCKDTKEVKTLMAMDEKKLPDAAKRTDSKLRIGKWKALQDGEGKGFRNIKTGETYRAKK